MPRTHDKGQATLARPIGEHLFALDSFRGEAASYLVNLQTSTCTCPHFVNRLAGTPGAECKHLTAARQQARFARLLTIARACTDSDLERLLIRYQELGDMETAGAIRCERQIRQQKAAAEATLRELFA